MENSLAYAKNPVSLLYEQSAKRKCTLDINFIETNKLTHLPVFECVVQFLGQKVSGKGRSKQEAKQEAAKFALKVLRELSEADNPSGNLLSFPEEEDTKFINSVGELMEYCTIKSYPIPTYELLDEIGPPHSRTFKLKCSVLHLSAIGEGKTKKNAKQECSKIVLQMLKENQVPEKKQILESNVKVAEMKKSDSLDILSVLRPILIDNETDSTERRLQEDNWNPFIGVKYKSHTLLKVLRDSSMITKESSVCLLEDIAKELNAPLLLEGIVDTNMFRQQERLITIKNTGNVNSLCTQSQKFNTNDFKIFVVSLKLDVELVALGSDISDATLNLLSYLLILSN